MICWDNSTNKCWAGMRTHGTCTWFTAHRRSGGEIFHLHLSSICIRRARKALVYTHKHWPQEWNNCLDDDVSFASTRCDAPKPPVSRRSGADVGTTLYCPCQRLLLDSHALF